MFCRRSASIQIRMAVFALSAAIFLFPAVSDVSAQEGDADRATVVGVAPGPLPAAAAVYLKIDDIKGEAEDRAHDDWIDVLSVDWGSRGTPARAAAGVRRRGGDPAARQRASVTFGDVTLTKSYDSSSPKLAEACANGTHIPSVAVEFATSTSEGLRYVTYELQDVTISSYSIFTTGDVPTEQVTLNFGKMESRYIPQEDRGKTLSAWKVESLDGKN